MPAVDGHLSTEDLERGLDEIRRSPADAGVIRLLVRRPGTNERETLNQGVLDCDLGLVGDNWITARESAGTDAVSFDDQLTLMNSRVIALLARDESRWPLAGDQIYVDLDLSVANLPAGTRLAIADAVIEVTSAPHLGCRKFAVRYGFDAMNFVNSRTGRQLRLRGLNARVIQRGTIRVGDVVRKIPPA